MTNEKLAEVERMFLAALLLSSAQQYRLAFLIAENIGYDLKSRDPLADLSIRKELENSRDLRAKLEVQSMRAMDQLRAQIRTLGAEPVL